MKKILKNLICIGLVLILSTSIVFATPDDDGGSGMLCAPSYVNGSLIGNHGSTGNGRPINNSHSKNNNYSINICNSMTITTL